jgi:16S rRNA (guanine527-N7)-methyltransferase
MGLLGPDPVARQIEHSQSLAALIGDVDGTFLDLGSGAGVPGLVLAGEWPRARGILLDAQRKRCRFLCDAVERLDLGSRLAVRCGRAEALARAPGLRGTADLVVARAFGRPAVTAECGVGFLRPGGRLVVSEPPPDIRDVETRWPTDAVARLGFAPPVPVRHGDAGAVILVLDRAVDDRWPRRDGRPAKSALW